MSRYRMDIFREGKRLGRRPALWRRYDIYALDDGAAKVAAEECYLDHATRRTLTSFSLSSSSGRFVCEFQALTSENIRELIATGRQPSLPATIRPQLT